MIASKVSISNPMVGHRRPYIYFIYTLQPEGLLYIGETEDYNGLLGRLAGHMKFNPPGTFVKKCIKNYIDYENDLCEINMIGLDLSEFQMFSGGTNKSQRRALEYLLHFEMIQLSSDDSVIIPYEVISHVEANSHHIQNNKIKDLSIELAKKVMKELPFIYPKIA